MKAWIAALALGLIAASAFAAPGGRADAPHTQVAAQIGQPKAQQAPAQPSPAKPVSGQAGPAPAKPGDRNATPNARPLTPTDPILAHLSPVYETCMHKAGGALDMLDCGARESERWDGRLNRAYQARMGSLNDRQRSALKRAEKAWLAFREADCAAYEDEEWGSVSRIDASQCILRRTVERTLELEAFPADHGPG